jgi:hypothetical protein
MDGAPEAFVGVLEGQLRQADRPSGRLTPRLER